MPLSCYPPEIQRRKLQLHINFSSVQHSTRLQSFFLLLFLLLFAETLVNVIMLSHNSASELVSTSLKVKRMNQGTMWQRRQPNNTWKRKKRRRSRSSATQKWMINEGKSPVARAHSFLTLFFLQLLEIAFTFLSMFHKTACAARQTRWFVRWSIIIMLAENMWMWKNWARK